MIIETIVWILFTIFIVWLSAVKTKHFMKERAFRKMNKDLLRMQMKPSLDKTLDDKMDYLRQKTNSGGDFMSIILSAIIFIVVFSILIYSRLPNIYVGLCSALAFALIFSWIAARIQFKKYVYEYKFIDSFIGYLFASTFMVYVKFTDNMYSLLLLAISIALMILLHNKINKWVGNEDLKRAKD